jgi:hypothetical protein
MPILYHGLDSQIPDLLHSEPFITTDTRKLILGLQTGDHGVVNVNLSRALLTANMSGEIATIKRLHPANLLAGTIDFEGTDSGFTYEGFVLETLKPLSGKSVTFDNLVISYRGGSYQSILDGTSDIGNTPTQDSRPQRSNNQSSHYDSYGRNINHIALASLYPMDPQEPYTQVADVTATKINSEDTVVLTYAGDFPDIEIGDVIYFGGMPGVPDVGQSTTYRATVVNTTPEEDSLTLNITAGAFTGANMYLARPRRLKTFAQCVADVTANWPNGVPNNSHGEPPLLLLQNQPRKYEFGDVLIIQYTIPVNGPFGSDENIEMITKSCIVKVKPTARGLYQSKRNHAMWNFRLSGDAGQEDMWYVKDYNDRRLAYSKGRITLGPRLAPMPGASNVENYMELLALASASAGTYKHAHIVQRPERWFPFDRLPLAPESHEIATNQLPGYLEYLYSEYRYVSPYNPGSRYDPYHPLYPDIDRMEGLVVDLVGIDHQFIHQTSGFSGFWPPLSDTNWTLTPDARFDYDAGLLATEPWRMRNGTVINTVHQINYVAANDTLRTKYETITSGRIVAVLASAASDRPNTINNDDAVFFANVLRYIPNEEYIQSIVQADGVIACDKRLGVGIGNTMHTPKYKYIRALVVANYNESTHSLQFAQNLLSGNDYDILTGDLLILQDPQLDQTPSYGDFVQLSAKNPVEIRTIGRFNSTDSWARCIVHPAPPNGMTIPGTTVWVVRMSGYHSEVDVIRPGSGSNLLIEGGFANPDANKPTILAGNRVVIDEIASIHEDQPQIPVIPQIEVQHQGLVRTKEFGALSMERHRDRGRHVSTSDFKINRPHGSGSVARNLPRHIVEIQGQSSLRSSNQVQVITFDLTGYRAGVELTSNTHFRLRFGGTPVQNLGGIVIRFPRTLHNGNPIIPNGWRMSYALDIPSYQFSRIGAQDIRAGKLVKGIDDTTLGGFFFSYTMDDGSLLAGQPATGADEWARRLYGTILTPHAPIAPSITQLEFATPELMQSSEFNSSTGFATGWSRLDWWSTRRSSISHIPMWNAEFYMVAGTWIETRRSSILIDRTNPMASASNMQSLLGRVPASTDFESLIPVAIYSDPYEHLFKTAVYTNHMNDLYSGTGNVDEDADTVPTNPYDLEYVGYDLADTLHQAVLGTMVASGVDRNNYLDIKNNQHRCAIIPYIAAP